MKKIIVSIVVALAASIAISQIMPPAQKLRLAEGVIENYYVDTVNADNLVEEAIKAMLATLDPHSSYSTPEETKALTEPLNGNFSGIGIQFNMMQDTLYVLTVIAGGPSERVGIRPGDRIISANDTTIAGVKMKNTDVMKHLRGPKGTPVDVKVVRRGCQQPLTFRIIRDDIPIFSIDAAYMATPTVGYVRISRFAAETASEFDKAVKKLRKQGMKDIIIDLEDNGGGLLDAAQEMAARFLDKGDLIVYTESPRMPQYTYTAPSNGDLRQGRVVVMVNQYSASASEILAGAIQDHDRGLIVGRRTFGKGLVQRPFPFPDGSMIRLTVSRYHTPSGRCIQKPYKKGDEDGYNHDMIDRYDRGELMNADSIHLDSTLIYKTLNTHRIVYGGGGIMPDRFVPIDTAFYSDYYRDIVAKGVLNQYTVAYVDSMRSSLKKNYPTELTYLSRFEVTPQMMQRLIDTATREGVKYVEDQYNVSEAYIRTLVKALIARDLYENGSYFRVANELDPVFREALRLIQDKDEYDNLLSGTKKQSPKR